MHGDAIAVVVFVFLMIMDGFSASGLPDEALVRGKINERFGHLKILHRPCEASTFKINNTKFGLGGRLSAFPKGFC